MPMLRCKQTLIPTRICPARRAPFPRRNRCRSARRTPFCGQFGGKEAGTLCTECAFLHRKKSARPETALPGFRIPFKLLTVRESVFRRRSVGSDNRRQPPFPPVVSRHSATVASPRMSTATSLFERFGAGPGTRASVPDPGWRGRRLPGDAFGCRRPASPAVSSTHLRGTAMRETNCAGRQRFGCCSWKRVVRRPRFVASFRAMPPTVGRVIQLRRRVAVALRGPACARQALRLHDRRTRQRCRSVERCGGASACRRPRRFLVRSRSQAAP